MYTAMTIEELLRAIESVQKEIKSQKIRSKDIIKSLDELKQIILWNRK